jgi:hypothetical protein
MAIALIRRDAAMNRPITTSSPTMAPWVPATRVGVRPRAMLSGTRVFAALAALVVLTRRNVA